MLTFALRSPNAESFGSAPLHSEQDWAGVFSLSFAGFAALEAVGLGFGCLLATQYGASVMPLWI